MGDVDFYPNGGRMQTGCSNLFLGAVSDIIWCKYFLNHIIFIYDKIYNDVIMNYIIWIIMIYIKILIINKKITKNKYTYKYGCKSMKYYLEFASK